MISVIDLVDADTKEKIPFIFRDGELTVLSSGIHTNVNVRLFQSGKLVDEISFEDFKKRVSLGL
jgi:hypothetical protein